MQALGNNVFYRSREILECSDVQNKCELTLALWRDWQERAVNTQTTPTEDKLLALGRPEYPKLVNPNDLQKRSFYTTQGRLIFMHAVAHIEFNAINLACDAVYRFQGLPDEYYGDWIRVAADEVHHFRLVKKYLEQFNCCYGDYPAHNGLWDMAIKTANDHLARLAIVPRVLEARGLDVTPGMITKLKEAGDQLAADILETIYEEEISHVAAGSRWFRFLCEQRQLNPDEHFLVLLKKYLGDLPRGPFNLVARRQAGFTEKELAMIG